MNDHPKANNNVASLPKEKCYGCGVCVNTCPVNCIKMSLDAEGFLHPSVDQQTCIECRKCILTCPGFTESEFDHLTDHPTFYAVLNNNDPVRLNSSSGGVFSLVANATLEKNGVVYGAAYDFNDLKVIHARAETVDDIKPMRKSKYVQSDSQLVFSQVKQDLRANKPVLFTGTPCQVDGLYLFLGEDHDHLVTADIICHGVPSQGLFAAHFSFLQNKYRQSLTNIDFRTKEKGWGHFWNFFLQCDFETASRLTFAAMDTYYALFLANLSLRLCCYQCKYATNKRKSDLTMGDFWGVEKNHPELFDGKGTSLVMANSQKGQALLTSLQDSATIQQVVAPEPLPPNLVQPTPRPNYRGVIFNKISFSSWSKDHRRFHLIAVMTIMKNKIFSAIRRLSGDTKSAS